MRDAGRAYRRAPAWFLWAALAGFGISWGASVWAQEAEVPEPPPLPVVDEKRDPCADVESRLERRRQWLAARRVEQFARGGAPDPELGIPDVTWQWCEAHPEDVDCNLPKVTVFFTTEELRGGQAPEDYDPHVVLMKRELQTCRDRERRGRPSR